MLLLALGALVAIRVYGLRDTVGIHFYCDTEVIDAYLQNRNGTIFAVCESQLHGEFRVEVGSIKSFPWEAPEVIQTNLVDVEYLLDGVQVAFYDFSEHKLTSSTP